MIDDRPEVDCPWWDGIPFPGLDVRHWFAPTPEGTK